MLRKLLPGILQVSRCYPPPLMKFLLRRYSLLVCAAGFIFVSNALSQEAPQTPPAPSSASPSTPATPGQPATPQSDEQRKKLAEQQLKQQERQRILGVIPEFNTTSNQGAVPLTTKQKFALAFRGSIDPFQFVAAGIDAGVSQWADDYSGYGQGAAGYAKRFGASYADAFDGNILGNALFPALLHEDPRYFRRGTGSIKSRILYAAETTVRCKSDNGNWVPNFGNVLGNLAAGGISNLYYPASDRGAALTIERALTVTAEGAFGALAFEFWPDIQRKLRKHH